MKLVEENNMQYFSGYVAYFNQIDRENNIINRHDALIGHELSLIWQHDVNKIIGKISGIKFDDIGIFVIGFIIDNKIDEMYIGILISNKLLSFSIGYLVNDFYMENDIKYLNQIELVEISLATIPMQRKTEVNLITLNEYNQLYSEIRNQLDANLLISQEATNPLN